MAASSYGGKFINKVIPPKSQLQQKLINRQDCASYTAIVKKFSKTISRKYYFSLFGEKTSGSLLN